MLPTLLRNVAPQTVRMRAMIDHSCIMASVPTSLAILGCSERKRQTSRLVPAIDRYDGPTFRVFRKYAHAAPEKPVHASILSARFGLVGRDVLIPRYNRRLANSGSAHFRALVADQLKRTLDTLQPNRVFVSVGRDYWPLVESTLAREVSSVDLMVASGGIGGRASQLEHWLTFGVCHGGTARSNDPVGEAVLLGTAVRLGREEVLRRAREAALVNPVAARRFETWHVVVGLQRFAPKWLASVLFDKPVARFRTADARRVLRQLGVETEYGN